MRIPRHLPTVIVVLAWLMFSASFFLPATNVVQSGGTAPGTPLTGWQAFTSSLEILFVQPLAIIAEPRILLFLAFPFINLAMLISPVPVLAWDDSWILSGFLLPFGLLPWIFPKSVTGELFIGFYLWDASFFVMTVGSILVGIRRRQIYENSMQAFRERGA